MELRQLKYFVAIAEEENFGAASRRLHISQPPLTRQIQKLEQELGVVLLRRTRKGAVPTEAGRVLLEDARDILARLERTRERVCVANGGELGRLEIGYFGSVSYRVLPQILSRFRDQSSDVELNLQRLSKSDQIDALRQGRLHLAFGRFYPEVAGLRAEDILHEGVALCVPEGWEEPFDEGRWQHAFDELELILYPKAGRPNFADRSLSILRREGISPKVGAVVEDARAALMQVAIGSGICLVPHSMLGLNWHGVRIARPDALAGDCPVSIIYRKADPSPLLRRFISMLHAMPLSESGMINHT